jgi:hypothetical protein
MPRSRLPVLSSNARSIVFGLGCALAVVALLQTSSVLAAGCAGADCGVDIGGSYAKIDSLENIAKTIQTLSIKYAAPVIGGILVLLGIYKIAMREAVAGAVAVLGGAGLLFLPKVIEQLSKFA